tara:strand:+ start:7635 stop:8867 length:1233 start_codon:yes stop_codon:yes gene_type:complete
MPQNWKTYKLGDITKLRKETIKPSEFNGEHYIGLEHIGQGSFLLDEMGVASDANSNKSKFKNGDILYGKIRPYFKKVYRPKFDGICSTDILVIKAKDEKIITQDFLHQIIKTQDFTDKASETSSGTKMPRADWNSLKALEYSLPSLEEQKEIAQILSVIDDKIENNLAINKTLEEMAMALYKHWFVDFGPFQDGTFVESELGEIPEGWEVKKIDDFGNVVCGKTPSKKKEEYYSSYDYPFIKIPDMHGNTWVLNTTEGLSEDGNKSQKNKLLPSGSINVSCIATVGLVTLNIIPSHTNQQINSLVPSKKNYRYYIYLTMLNMKQIFLNEASGGSATLNMNTSTFSSLSILKPNDKILEDFHLIIKNYFEQIKSNQIENQTLTQLRDTLLPKLISGEARLKEFAEQIETAL